MYHTYIMLWVLETLSYMLWVLKYTISLLHPTAQSAVSLTTGQGATSCRPELKWRIYSALLKLDTTQCLWSS